MLREIRCSEFRDKNGPRPPIVFEKGLNVVIGNESGTNSVGKSTFLMIIDFVFGGQDYVRKSKEVHDNLAPHTICFEFVFGEDHYYFARSTNDSDVVTLCDATYQAIEEWPLNKYMNFLQDKYGLTEYGLTFRSAISRSFRIDRRETLDENKPFQIAKSQSDEKAIIEMLKLFGLYEEVEKEEKAAAEAEEKYQTFLAAQKYDYIPFARNLTEYRANVKKIAELQHEARKLAEQSSRGLLDLDSVQAMSLRDIRSKLAGFRRQRTRMKSQLDSIGMSRSESRKTFQRDYEDLRAFFPNIDVARLEQVEEFHRKLTTILGDEMNESATEIEAMITLAEQEIKNLEEEQMRISQLPNVSKAILERYAAIQRDLQTRQAANDSYLQKSSLSKEASDLAAQRDGSIRDRLEGICHRLNRLMEDYNNYIYPVKMESPTLVVESAKKYVFSTPNDGGIGMRYKGLILFDLALLHATNLPVIAHDSVLLLQIERETVEKLLELYEQTAAIGKQVFVAFDKDTTEHGREILERTKRLHLTRGGDELFGESWNLKKPDKQADVSKQDDDSPDAETDTADQPEQLTMDLPMPQESASEGKGSSAPEQEGQGKNG